MPFFEELSCTFAQDRRTGKPTVQVQVELYFSSLSLFLSGRTPGTKKQDARHNCEGTAVDVRNVDHNAMPSTSQTALHLFPHGP